MKILSSSLVALGGAALLALAGSPALAGPSNPSPAYVPSVPVSAFAFPSSWLDPSRLHVSSMVSVGSSGGRSGFDALQVTSLQYAFGPPLAVSVNIGNAWGPNAAGRGSAMFLEGFDVRYRPSPSLQFQIQYRDIRSPLQLSRTGYDSWGW